MKSFTGFSGKIIAVLAISWICSCASDIEKSVSVCQRTPPFENVSVKAEGNRVDPAKGADIKTAKGSHYVIPENAFVFEDGTVVTEPVNVKISEYRSAAEILVSGISMKYDSAGTAYDFESAGMFEIRGDCEGREVNLAAGKEIQVSYASLAEGDYNFYFMDEKTGKWNLEATAKKLVTEPAITSDSSVSKIKYKTNVNILKPIQPKRIDKKKSIIDFDINLTNFPEINMYNGIVWQYSGNQKFPDPDHDQWIFSTTWNECKLVAGTDSNEYILKLRGSQKSYVTSVVPVLNARDYKKSEAIFEKSMEKYQKLVAEMQSEIKRKSQEGQLMRVFSVQNMGIYNYDRVCSDPGRIAVKADFVFDQAKLTQINKITIYFITDEGRSVIMFPPDKWNNFAFNPEKENKIIAVLPEDKIAYFSAEDFRKLNIENLRSAKSYVFNLKIADQKIESSDHLNEVIAAL